MTLPSQERIEQIKARIKLRAKKALNYTAHTLQRAIKDIMGSENGDYRAKSGAPPEVRSGRYRNSIVVDDTDLSQMRIRIGTNAIQGRILEYGGIISSKGKKLAIPLNEAARRIARDTKGSLRNRTDLFVLPIRGKVFLARKVGKKQKVQILFILKDSVRINPHPHFRPAFSQAQDKMKDDFAKIMGETVLVSEGAA